jgi:ABC-type phosphate transport system substrate-binding protein
MSLPYARPRSAPSRLIASTIRAPGGATVRTWGDLGLKGEWAGRPIALYSRNTISGTYEYFREIALYGGDYKPEVKLLPGSEAVVESVAGDRFGIGYSGIGYKTDGVRAVPLASYYGGTCYDAAIEPALSGKYPIARYLYVYLNKKPDQSLDPVRAEFIKFILSKDGQEPTEKGGFYPIKSGGRSGTPYLCYYKCFRVLRLPNRVARGTADGRFNEESIPEILS